MAISKTTTPTTTKSKCWQGRGGFGTLTHSGNAIWYQIRSPPPHRPCLSVSASPPVSLCLPLFSVPASPSDSVLRLCVCLSSATSGSTFRPCQETCGSGRCLTSEQQPRAHRGPCPHPRGLQSPDWDEAAKGKGREKGSRLPRVTQLGGGEARECRGAQTGCRRARTGWRGQLCTESLGPGQRLPHNPPGPFSAGPFPLKLVLAWGLCTSHSLRNCSVVSESLQPHGL